MKNNKHDKSLAIKNPNLAKEWHPAKNGELTPNDITAGSEKRVGGDAVKGTNGRQKSLIEMEVMAVLLAEDMAENQKLVHNFIKL